jgi:hypothetical protein
MALAALFLLGLFLSPRAGAQFPPFNSHSDGTDLALNITAPGVTYLDPKAMNIDANGDNIFNFTTINIASGSILKISELKVHGPIYFLAQSDVTINGVIDLRGDDSPGSTATAAEQIPAYAGSGGYSGGLGGIHGDPNHQALPGNGPGGGAAGDINTPQAVGGAFTTNRFLVPLVGGSGAGGTNDNGVYGSQGGAGGGALLIASTTKITLGSSGGTVNGLANGFIYASGGSGGGRGCGGAGGAVRLVTNLISGVNSSFGIIVAAGTGNVCKSAAQPGFARLETNSFANFSTGNVTGPAVTSLPFSLNLPSSPPPVITVASINGQPFNANPFSFPDTTINSTTPVPVVIKATNLPVNATVTLYLLSDTSPNQAIQVTLSGNSTSSTATVPVLFASGGTRGFVKATW